MSDGGAGPGSVPQPREGSQGHAAVLRAIRSHRPSDPEEAADLERLGCLLESDTADPWGRAAPVHLTGSALVLYPPSRRVLLRWHEHLGRFLHVGGHGEAGERDPFAVALREATEETALADLVPWPGPEPLLAQVAIVHVPPRRAEPAHEHADLRYLLATATPELARPEKVQAILVWRSIDEALREVGADRLAVCLRLAATMLAAGRTI